MPTSPKNERSRKRAVGWWGLLLTLTGSLVAAAPTALSELGLWQAATVLSVGSDDRTRGDSIAGWLSSLAHGFQVDDATALWLEDLRDGMLELDLHRTWRRLPDVDGERRQVHITGRGMGTRGYSLTLDARGRPPSAALGDVDGSVGLVPQPWQNATAYTAFGHVALSSHPLSHRDARAVVAALAEALERAVRDTTGPATNGALEARVRTDFPNTMAMLDRVLTVDTWARPLDDGVLQVDLSVHIDPQRLASAGYPALAQFVRRMGSVADLALAMHHPKGELAAVWVRSPGTYGVRFAIRDSALVPIRNGQPAVAHSLDIASTTDARLALRPRGIVRLKGTRLAVDHWTVPLRYTVQGDRAQLAADFVTLPAVDFRSDGGLAGFVVATAGNAVGLESHALRFFESIAEGPDGPGGTGSTIHVAMHDGTGHQSLDAQWNVRMLDNLVVRFAAQVLGHRILPDDAVLDELIAVERQLAAALADDWYAARDRVAAATATQGSDDRTGASDIP